MAAGTVKVAAIVVAHNSAADLPHSLGAWPPCRWTASWSWTTRRPTTVSTVARPYTPHVLRRAERGFGAGVNAAAASRRRDADAYLLFNPDCHDPRAELRGPLVAALADARPGGGRAA